MRPIYVTLALLGLSLGASWTAHATNDTARYEIVKASEQSVWRLDKVTGEIAVCSLRGPQLVCTSSVDAAVPPSKTYAQLEAEREALSQEQALEREARRKRQAAMINKMLGLFQDLANSSNSY